MNSNKKLKPLNPPTCLILAFSDWPYEFFAYSWATNAAEAILASYRTFDDLGERIDETI